MACTQTLSGLARDCDPNRGGIIAVYIANFDDVTAITVTSGQVSGITMDTGKKFKEYAFPKNTGSLTSTYTIDPASGVRYVTSDLVLQFNRMETTKRTEITALALSDLRVICKDANGVFWLLGFDEPVNASQSDGQTGTARSDANRYTITLEDTSAEMPYEIDDSIISGIVA